MSILFVTALTLAMCTQTAAEAHEIRGWRGTGVVRARPAAAPAAASTEGAMQVNSKIISPGGEFPKRHTCDGADLSPDLAWSQVPAGAKSLALILDDPDAPRGTFTHWILFNMPPTLTHLPESLDKNASELAVGSQGRNDFGKLGYGGPCPPPGKPHRYFFRLYALDTVLGLKAGAGRDELERAMRGHVVARGELMGRYGR
jgi:Raf kinase inhibitor-like YbhB/YbcL family protein